MEPYVLSDPVSEYICINLIISEALASLKPDMTYIIKKRGSSILNIYIYFFLFLLMYVFLSGESHGQRAWWASTLQSVESQRVGHK